MEDGLEHKGTTKNFLFVEIQLSLGGEYIKVVCTIHCRVDFDQIQCKKNIITNI